ncbi:MAG: hypothetical protein Q9167_003407 [Letrouitia subvulpina]
MPLSSDDSSPPAITTPNNSNNNDKNHTRGYLSGHISHIRCARCATDLCSTSQIISKGFTGRHGRAYLVSAAPIANSLADSPDPACRSGLPNTRTHKPVPRQLVTGAHTVSDVSCAFCGSVIGWKYDSAEEETQRYKVGKFILETKKIFSSSCWEGDNDEPGDPTALLELNDEGKRSVEFDSGDEDECEDLFAGVWSPALAIKRRQGKRLGRSVAEEALKPEIA